MRASILRAHLETALTNSRPIHLDGLLLAARERHEGVLDLERPLDCIAVDRGVYRASAGVMVADDMLGASVMPIKRVWRFRSEDIVGSAFFRLHATDGAPIPKKQRTIPTANNPWKNNFRTQEVLSGVSSVAWQFLGDPERVLELARSVDCLGASSVTGFGRVRRWEIEPCDAAGDGVGWYAEGRVLRNLPVELAPAGILRSGTGHMRAVERVAPPYWIADGRRDCLVPTFRSLFANGDAADQRLSYAA